MAKNLIKEMKEAVAKSGSSKKEILYFGADSSHRVRFLQELDSGYSIEFHSNWDPQIFTPCKDPVDHGDCELCKDGIALQEQYVWSVWDYDSNAVRLLMFKATGISPIPGLIEMYEEFGTILDRDYKIKKVGKGMGGSYVVTPLDKSKFRNTKAKPFSEKMVKELISKAFPSENTDTDDEDDDVDNEVVETKKSKKVSKKQKKEPTLREKYEELDMDELKSICSEIGMSKKEIRGFNDEDEILDELFDNYEEDDLEELLDILGLDDDNDDDE